MARTLSPASSSSSGHGVDDKKAWQSSSAQAPTFRVGEVVVPSTGSTLRIKGVLGKGRGGAIVYLAEGIWDSSWEVVVKYPAGQTESRVLCYIHRCGFRCLGMPKLWGEGKLQDRSYIVMERLDAPLSWLFERLLQEPWDVRWPSMQMLGRLLLRRLEGLHGLGYVHCDLSPENIMLDGVSQHGCLQGTPRLVLLDLNNARHFPGGSPMKPYWGTVEFLSIHSAEGAKQERGPWDDVESLGWMLCHGLFGELPWFRWLQDRSWRGNSRLVACSKVKDEKLMALQLGWGTLGLSWLHLAQMPIEMSKFLWCCRRGSLGSPNELPNYHSLARLLGAEELDDVYANQAERTDISLLGELLVRLHPDDRTAT